MATMIKVTERGSGTAAWVNPEYVESVQQVPSKYGYVTLISLANQDRGWIEVQESAEQVIEMINGTVSRTEPVS